MRIVLKPYFTAPVFGADLRNARLRIEVVEAVDITPSVFLHERYTINGDNGLVQENRFIAVAKPGDINVYPVGAPRPNQEPPFFRTNCLDLVLNSPTLLEESFSGIVDDVTKLVRAMVHLNELVAQDAVVIEG